MVNCISTIPLPFLSNLKTLIENHPPLMVLCGHIHEQAGYQFFKSILVVNCAMNKKYGGAIIDCENRVAFEDKNDNKRQINK